MAVNNLYRYEVSLIFVDDDTTHEILQESISTIITDYKYLENTMPLIYIEMNIKSELYDLMVTKSSTAKIIFTMKRYDKNTFSGLNRKVIQEEFTYLMQTDPDYHKPLDKLESARENNPTSYKKCVIVLISDSLVENNKVLYNDIIYDSNMISIVHKYTKHMPMVIEPFTNNKNIPCLIIPPMTGIHDLLKFLNEFSCFYDEGYRYFRDFDKSYILSNKGNPVQDDSDKYDTVIIEIMDTTDYESKNAGIITDPVRKVYILQVDSLDTHININIARDKEYNHIIGITSSGNVEKKDLLLTDEDIKEKSLLQRIKNDNITYLDNIKNSIDGGSVVLQISKTEMDTSIFTPNKEYIIKNYREYSEYNGRFLLVSKKDIFLQQDDEFISSGSLIFRKV